MGYVFLTGIRELEGRRLICRQCSGSGIVFSRHVYAGAVKRNALE